MDKNYNVDDILAEVRQKKQQSREPEPPLTPVQEEPKRAVQPEKAPAEPSFFGKLKHKTEEPEESPYQSMGSYSDQAPAETEKPWKGFKFNREDVVGDPFEESPKPKPKHTRFDEFDDSPPPKGGDFENFIKTKAAKIKDNFFDDEDVFSDVKRSHFADEQTKTDLPKGGILAFDDDDDDQPRGGIFAGRKGKGVGSETLAYNPSELQMNFGGEDDEDDDLAKSKKPPVKKKARQPVLDDYTSPEDKPSIIKDFKQIKIRLNLRLAFAFIAMLGSVYLSCSVLSTSIPLPNMIWPETETKMFLLVHTVLLVVAMLICSNIVGSGLASLFRMKGDTDTLLALASIACVGQGIIYIMNPDVFLSRPTNMFITIVIIGFVFNLLGKIMLSNRVARNFKFIAHEGEKKGMTLVNDSRLLAELTKGVEMENYDIAYGQPASHLSEFLELSYYEDQGDMLYKFLSPICLGGAFALGVVAFFTSGKDVCAALSAFAATLTVSSALTTTLIVNMPMDRLSTKLTKMGAMVSGYGAVDNCYDLEGVMVSASDLFAPDRLILHGIKTIDESLIDPTLIAAASVVCTREHPLSGVLAQILDGNMKLLRPVDGVHYVDSMGLVAEVEGREVLIGSRSLMENYGIVPPSHDYEARLKSDGRDIIYLAYGGTLCAVLVVTYCVTEETLVIMERLDRDGMHLFVQTEDPNVTPQKVEDLVGFPHEYVHMVSGAGQECYERLQQTPVSVPAEVCFVGDNFGMLNSIVGAMAVKKAVGVGLIVQILFVVLGYGIITLLSVQGSIGALGFFHILLYQSIAAVVSLVISNLRRI